MTATVRTSAPAFAENFQFFLASPFDVLPHVSGKAQASPKVVEGRYTLRHTCLTRWAKHMDPFTLPVLAGHTDMNTTKRYVHPNEADIREAMSKVWTGHISGHTAQNDNRQADTDSPTTDRFDRDLDGATRRDRTGDLLITNQPLYQLS